MMSSLRIVICAAAIALAGCASKPDIVVLKPAESATLPLKTFAWPMGKPLQDKPPQFDPRHAKALERAIAESLEQKGYVLTADDQSADLLVAVRVTGEWQTDIGESWHYGNPAQGLGTEADRYSERAAGSPLPSPDALGAAYNAYQADQVIQLYVDGAITVDVQDRTAGTDLWKGAIRKEVRQSDVSDFRKQISKDIQRLLKAFPVHAQP